MSVEDTIIGIYAHTSDDSAKKIDKHHSANYLIKYIFNRDGLLDEEILAKAYKQLSKKGKERGGPGKYFEDISSLSDFARSVCEEVNASRISLISVQKYNAILEEVSSVTELQSALREQGKILTNSNFKGKGSLLGKIFS